MKNHWAWDSFSSGSMLPNALPLRTYVTQAFLVHDCIDDGHVSKRCFSWVFTRSVSSVAEVAIKIPSTKKSSKILVVVETLWNKRFSTLNLTVEEGPVAARLMASRIAAQGPEGGKTSGKPEASKRHATGAGSIPLLWKWSSTSRQ